MLLQEHVGALRDAVQVAVLKLTEDITRATAAHYNGLITATEMAEEVSTTLDKIKLTTEALDEVRAGFISNVTDLNSYKNKSAENTMGVTEK